MDNTPIILTGPPGCGKSYWIQKHAQKIKKQLFVCPCRKDRTLRDGRQKLHIWARRTEPAILWLEGADDLTPEAQAFLRRILETHATETLFILECRNAGRLQEPIRSRCKIKKIHQPTWLELEQYILSYEIHSSLPSKKINSNEICEYLKKNEYSYRRIKQCIYLQCNYPDTWTNMVKHRYQENKVAQNQSADKLISYIKDGYNPEILINSLISNEMILKDYGNCTELSGSLWAFLGSALYNALTTPQNQEE